MLFIALFGLVGLASAANQVASKMARRKLTWPSGPRPKATLSAPSGADGFGNTVAVSGNGKGLVGAWTSGNLKGKVFLYSVNDIDITEPQELVVCNLEDYSKFGSAVAFSDDGTIVVGALGSDNHEKRGAVYVNPFIESGGSGQICSQTEETINSEGSLEIHSQTRKTNNIPEPETDKIISEDSRPGDMFGWSLAASGGSVVIGAPVYDDQASVYIHPSGIQLTPEEEKEGDGFGWSVALSNAALVVGAPWDDDNGIASGSAHVFQPEAQFGTGYFVHTKKLTPIDGEDLGCFGCAVAITETKIFVGAPGKGDKSGGVYRYGLSGDYAGNYTGHERNQFGHSLAASNNVLVVGAPGFSSQDPGTVYVFEDGFNVITIDNPDPDIVTGFGWAVSISGNTLLVGTYSGDKAYVYSLSGIEFLDVREA